MTNEVWKNIIKNRINEEIDLLKEDDNYSDIYILLEKKVSFLDRKLKGEDDFTFQNLKDISNILHLDFEYLVSDKTKEYYHKKLLEELLIKYTDKRENIHYLMTIIEELKLTEREYKEVFNCSFIYILGEIEYKKSKEEIISIIEKELDQERTMNSNSLFNEKIEKDFQELLDTELLELYKDASEGDTPSVYNLIKLTIIEKVYRNNDLFELSESEVKNLLLKYNESNLLLDIVNKILLLSFPSINDIFNDKIREFDVYKLIEYKDFFNDSNEDKLDSEDDF